MATQLNERFVLAEDAAVKRKFEGMQVSYPQPRNVGVWFRWPNKEIRDVTWPFIAIDLVDIVKASHREHQGSPFSLMRSDGPYEPYGYDADEQLIDGGWVPVAEEWPTPYDLFYTITVACRDPRHERELLTKMLGQKNLAPHRWGFLEIPEDNTTRRFETVSVNDMTGRNSANDIEYRRVYTIRVESELFTGWVEDKLRPSLATLVLTGQGTSIEEEVAKDLPLTFE